MFTLFKDKRWLSIALLLALGFLWGSGYSLARFAMTHGVQPLGYSFWQSLGPTIALLAGMWLFGKRPLLVKQHSLFYFICGLLGVAIPNSLMYFAVAHLPAGLLAVIVNTAPIMTYALAVMLRLEPFILMRLLGVLCGVAGILLIILPKTILPTSVLTQWALLALLTPLCFASCAIYCTKQRPTDSDVISLSAGMLLSSSVLLTPLVLATHSFYSLMPPLTSAGWVIILEIILSSLGYLIFFKLLKIAGAVYYSLVGAVVALTGLFWGWVIFDERLNRWAVAAVTLILIAILLVTLWQVPTAKQTKVVAVDS